MVGGGGDWILSGSLPFCHPVTPPKGGRPRIEYVLMVDAAKHICMLCETERGHEVRDYFTACKRAAKAAVKPRELSQLEVLQMALESEQRENSPISSPMPTRRFRRAATVFARNRNPPSAPRASQ